MPNPAWKSGRSLLICAVMLFGSADLAAVETKYETPFGLLVVDVDANWSSADTLPEGIDGIGFEVDGVMQFVLGTIEGVPPGSIDERTLRDLTNDLRRKNAELKLIVSEETMSLSGPNFRGYYYQATNPATMPAPGTYKHMYMGFVAVGSIPLMFVIAWNAGGKTSADRALTTLNRLRIERR